MVKKIKKAEKQENDNRSVRKRRLNNLKPVYPVKQDIHQLLQNKSIQSAFVTQEDSNSVDDLKRHIHELNVVFPNYFTLSKDSLDINENVESSFLDYVKGQNITVFPTLTNVSSDGNWFGSDFGKMINSEDKQNQLCELILNTLLKYKLKGVNLDIEALESEDGKNYIDFLDTLASVLHQNDMYLSVDVPINDDAYDYESIGKIADMAVVMAYDEHYSGGQSGPIAGRDWFADGVEGILKEIPKEKVIVSVGQYAYDWNVDKKSQAKSLSFDDVMALAHDVGAEIETDKDSVNSNFSYKDDQGALHNVWFLDGISLWNQMQEIKNTGVSGVALWRIGLEDPSIWGFYSLKDLSAFDPSKLSKVRNLQNAEYIGDGEILNVSTSPEEGERDVTFDGRMIDYAGYKKIPTSYEVKRFGHTSKQELVLTFDDGPDQKYTNEILDVLKTYNIKATFFIVGDQAQRFPDVIKREVDEGHLVGNHTYMHPNIEQLQGDRLKYELNSVQRLFEAVLGKQSVLFRTPYNTDSTPTYRPQLSALYQSTKMGYTLVTADIDSTDYEKPGVDKIVNTVCDQIKSTGSNIIVMHDAGGNRDQTVQALKILIPKLQKMNYKFVNINDLLGVPKDSLITNITPGEQVIVFADKVWTWIREWGWTFIVILFFISTLISVARIVFLGGLVIKSRKTLKYDSDALFNPFVSVLIPAYNEEKVIEKTLSNLMKSNYKNIEVLVIDDGSKDSTADIVRDFALSNDIVRLITKENGGKFSALNLGFTEAKADYIVTIDADTIILPDTIENLIMPFADSKVDAVCGNVQVGNDKNILTGFQTVEYITTQNYDRRAFDVLNCISVVPGATGAWKKSKVIEAGGYSSETLTEDADLTLTMLEHKARIVYAPAARSITEAPETTSALFKQRFRWSFGTFQCLWKHRKSFFKGNLGYFALPNMFIFQILFPVLSPIGDLVFILSLFRGDMKAILSGYILFLFMDLAGSVMAFTLEKSPKKYLWLILIQRFFYRQFMYVVTFKSIFAAVRGKRHGWNKLERTSSAHI
jgi:cellulose synthase/poly-beta-1,6-N-acetylglucosamine synthase-like glycosyltransferase/spore germination protein YaaH/peptidoglycan/xylan/chitin deacetylase (PgdA/CDA1 family)